MVVTEDQVIADETVTALARCREAWIAFSLSLVLTMQRDAWTMADMLAAVARYRDLEPLYMALNRDGGLAEVCPTLPNVARVLGIEGDLSDAQILDAAALFFDGLTKEYERARLAGLAA